MTLWMAKKFTEEEDDNVEDSTEKEDDNVEKAEKNLPRVFFFSSKDRHHVHRHRENYR